MLASSEASTTTTGSNRFWVALVVVALLAVHVGLAIHSLLGENPTVDEVAHLPAGVTYWQKGTFKLYHHNPPLVKLVAAIPVVLANPKTAPLYELKAWTEDSHPTFGERFALENVGRYLDLFARARMLMPLFSVLGGLAVFAWSRRLYGTWGGLLSLTLWTFCPNILAHGRLVTSDVAAASFAVASTYLFVRYLDRPTWQRAALAGLALGLAELTKFSLILLYGFWPTLALVRLALGPKPLGWTRELIPMLVQGLAIVALSVVVIDLGYGFEAVGQPLGRFEFASKSLTVPRPPGQFSPTSPNNLLNSAWRYRVNRFRGTLLEKLPVPLPRHYVLGFDEQKIETEGVPRYFFNPNLPEDDSVKSGYSVYLNGELRRSGWWYFYLATLAYKVPEGTWLLVALGGLLLMTTRRPLISWGDEFAVLALPVGVLAAMSFLTDICLGLRYILPIFPFVFVATGKIAPWIIGLGQRSRRFATGLVVAALGSNVLAVALIHPHYLAYFNQVSGGPDHGSEHLIDSNLDWGQDLLALGRWLRTNHPGRRVGLAYFGQVNPSLLKVGGNEAGFDWFLPPALGTFEAMSTNSSIMIGPAKRLTPGLYAVSASIVRGLPWRFYDSVSLVAPRLAWQAAWAADSNAFAYFAKLQPVAKIGHSIFVYEVTNEDCARWTEVSKRAKLKE